MDTDADPVTDALFARRVDALEAAWDRWAELGAALDEDGWTSPTRCAGWDVAAQFAHVGMFPTILAGPLPPAGDGERATAVQILRGFNRPEGVAHEMAGQVADAAVQAAAGAGRDRLVGLYAEDGPRGIEALRRAGARTLVPWPAAGVAVALVEGVRIILMESTVHLLDVLDALGRAPEPPADALRETADLLAAVADPVALIEAASGRVAASPLPVLR